MGRLVSIEREPLENNSQVEVREVSPRLLAAVSEETSFAALPSIVRRLFDEVYAYIRTQNEVVQTGHNVLLYLDSLPTVVAGVEVSGVFAPAGRVRPAETPAGRVTHQTHVGPYSALSETHARIRA